MSFWIQHGWGKGSKVNVLAEGGFVEGIILSPGDEEASALASTARMATQAGLTVALDPQLYVHSIQGGSASRHQSHALDFGRIHWSTLTAQDISDHVTAVLEANARLGITAPIIAPSPFQGAMNDAWATVAFQYARATLDMAGNRDVLASVVMDEAVLSDWDNVDEWLDVATSLDVAGFHLVFSRPPLYPYTAEPDRVRSLLRLIYRLTELNDFQLVWGYADIEGLLGLVAGATAVASGWFQTHRVFNPAKWQAQPGVKKQPQPRVTSPTLLTPLLAESEADQVMATSLAPEVFPDPSLRQRLQGGGSSWTRSESQVQHLDVLGQLCNEVAQGGTVEHRSATLRSLLTEAQNLMQRLEKAGVVMARLYRSRLDAMLLALDGFLEAEGL